MARGWPLTLAGVAVAAVVVLMLLRSTIGQGISVDQRAGTVAFSRTRLLAFGRSGRIERIARPISEISLVLREASLNRQSIVLQFEGGGRWAWSFKAEAAEVDLLANLVRGEIRRLREPAEAELQALQQDSRDTTLPTAPETPDRAVTNQLLQRVRSAAFWSLGLGVLHFVVPGVSPAWGVTLVLVGALSLLVPTPALELVNAITILWVAVMNALGGSGMWFGIAGLQLVNGVQGFSRWRTAERQRKAQEGDLPVDPREARARKLLPWIGLGLGLSAAIGLIGVFATAIVHTMLVGPEGGSATYYTMIGFVESVVVNLGVVGIAVSLASLLAGFRPRPVAVVGLLGGAAALALEFGLLWLSAA
ncbi:MAG TPA: hypothetical protein PLC98_14215 [Anaerolineales bacterium]|nr:hypothetical protein [Anaerolineales bacterium]